MKPNHATRFGGQRFLTLVANLPFCCLLVLASNLEAFQLNVDPTLLSSEGGTLVRATISGGEFYTGTQYNYRVCMVNGVQLSDPLQPVSILSTRLDFLFPKLDPGLYGFVVQTQDPRSWAWTNMYKSSTNFFKVVLPSELRTGQTYQWSNPDYPSVQRNPWEFLPTRFCLGTGVISGTIMVPRHVNDGADVLNLEWTDTFGYPWPLSEVFSEEIGGVIWSFDFRLDGYAGFTFRVPFEVTYEFPHEVYAGQKIRFKATGFSMLNTSEHKASLSVEHAYDYSTDHHLMVNVPYDTIPPLDIYLSQSRNSFTVSGSAPILPWTGLSFEELDLSRLFGNGTISPYEGVLLRFGGTNNYTNVGGETKEPDTLGSHQVWTPQSISPELWHSDADQIKILANCSIPYVSPACGILVAAGVELPQTFGIQVKSQDFIHLKPPYLYDFEVPIPYEASGHKSYHVTNACRLKFEYYLISDFIYQMVGSLKFDMPYIDEQTLDNWNIKEIFAQRQQSQFPMTMEVEFNVDTTVDVLGKNLWMQTYVPSLLSSSALYGANHTPAGAAADASLPEVNLANYTLAEAAAEKVRLANLSYNEPLVRSIYPTRIRQTLPVRPESKYVLLPATKARGDGEIIANPAPVDGGYAAGKAVTLTAQPVSGYRFVRWDGGLSGTVNPLNLTVNSNLAISAVFEPVLPMVTLVNPSFELDIFTNLPGYVSENGALTGWSAERYMGINPLSPYGPTNNYFTDNGQIPEGRQAAFIQQDGALKQMVKGLVVGGTYRVDYFENSRLHAESEDPQLEVRMGAMVIVPAHGVPSVGTRSPYTYTFQQSQPFVATSSEMELAFVKVGPAGLDRTALIDDVRVLYLAPPTVTERYWLTVNGKPSTGGWHTLNPAPDTDGKYAAGTVVTLTANPASGYKFSGWEGALSGTANPASFTVISNVSVTARFVTVLPMATLINPSFEADTFTKIPGYERDNGPITGWVAEGGLGINPIAPFGSDNNYFTDNGQIPDGRQAAFIQDGALRQVVKGLVLGGLYRVDYCENGRLHGDLGDPELEVRMGGMVIDSAHAVPPVGGTNPYTPKQSSTFVASASEMELAFVKVGPAGLDRTVLIDDVRVVFVIAGPAGTFYSLTLATMPPGSGTVEANPISESGRYAVGTPVTLTATAAAGYQFNGWSGSLTGVANPATVTLDGDKRVTANFVAVTNSMFQYGLRRQLYTNLPGSAISELLGSPKFPSAPDLVDVVPNLESQYLPDDAGENYGQRLTGWLVPPQTGDYVFYLASDDAAQVFLSTDESMAKKQLIVEETGWNVARNWEGPFAASPIINAGTQQPFPQRASASIPLTAGKHYYVEVLHKEGSGGDHVAVAWQLPGGAAPTNGSDPIGGTNLVYRTDMADFLVLPASFAQPVASGSQRGFSVRLVQTAGTNEWPNSLVRTEEQLAGVYRDNGVLAKPDILACETPEVINYSETTIDGVMVPFGNFGGDRHFPGLPQGYSASTRNVAMEMVAYLQLDAGHYRFGVNSDDGFRLTMGATPQDSSVALGFYDGGRGASDTLFDFAVPTSGLYPFRLIWEQGGGGYNVEWFSVASDGTRTLINGTNAAGQVPVPAYRFCSTLANPVTITQSPAPQTVAVGHTATFTVGAHYQGVSNPATLVYQWKVGTTEIAGAQTPTLVLPAVLMADTGQSYACLVGLLGYPRITSTAATLTVTESTLLSDVTQPGDVIVPTSNNSPPNEGVTGAIDNSVTNKYLNFDKLNAGFTVTPGVGATVVTGLGLTSANDSPERDPASYRLEGSQDGRTFLLIAAGVVPVFANRFEAHNLWFSNATAYRVYRVLFPTIVDANLANSMQIGEVELFGTVVPAFTLTSSVLPLASGAVAVSPGSPDGQYLSNTVVTLTATAAAGYQFNGWSGSLTGVANPATVTLDGDKRITANFVAVTNSMFQYGLRRQLYTNLPGSAMAELLGSPKFPSAPDLVDVVPNLESQYLPDDAGENYGQRLTGWLVPPISGNYVFYLASDDAGQVFLSTDETSANKRLIVEEAGWSPWRNWEGTTTNPQRASGNISLVAGQYYYLEVLHKEGIAGDHVAVAWRLPGGAAPTNGSNPIGGTNLVYRTNMPEVLLYAATARAIPFGGGTVQVSPAPHAYGKYASGTVVTLTANPASGYKFSGWDGTLSGSANPASVTVNGPVSVTAQFETVLPPVALINPSFEADTFTTIPGYVKDNGPITGWASEAYMGLNPISPFGPDNNYFTDNGVIPDGRQAAFLQQDGALKQVVKGLIVGGTYRVDYCENGRLHGDPDDAQLEVRMGGAVVVPTHSVPPVGDSNPYEAKQSASFVATASEMELMFVKVGPAGLDRTVLIDHVRVVCLARPLRLFVNLDKGNLTLSWDAAASGCTLETTASLIPPGQWTPVSGVINNQVTVPIQGTTRFYRVRQ